MAISPIGFSFNGISSEEFNLIMCSLDSEDNQDMNNAGSKIEFSKTSTPINKKWYKTGNANYQEPLSFIISVCKSNFEPFDTYEQSAISRWLIKQDTYKELNIIQSDYDDITYMAMVNNIEYQGFGNVLFMLISFVCDSSFGYGHIFTKRIDKTENTFQIIDMSDEIGYIYPNIKIRILSDCDFKLYNEIENREFYIKNCKKDELITIDGNILQIHSSNPNHDIYNDSNYIFPRIVNKHNCRKNNFTITGESEIEISYRPIKKVGV